MTGVTTRQRETLLQNDASTLLYDFPGSIKPDSAQSRHDLQAVAKVTRVEP
jgi:ribosome biogenesis GTPase A